MGKLDPNVVEQLVEGMSRACRKAAVRSSAAKPRRCPVLSAG